MRRLHIVLIASCGALAIACYVWSTSKADVKPPLAPPRRVPVVPVKDTGTWLEPGFERATITFVPEAALGSVHDSNWLHAEAIRRIEHQGQLAGPDLEALVRSVQEYAHLRNQLLMEYSAKVDATQKSQVAEEAGLLAVLEIATAAEDAVRRGSYVTLLPPETLIDIPGCEVLATRAVKDGKDMNVVVVMPHDKYPRLAQARQYQQVTQEVAGQMLADAFNARSDQERHDMIERQAQLLSRRSAGELLGADDLSFLHNTMGLGLPVFIDSTRNLMHVRER